MSGVRGNRQNPSSKTCLYFEPKSKMVTNSNLYSGYKKAIRTFMLSNVKNKLIANGFLQRCAFNRGLQPTESLHGHAANLTHFKAQLHVPRSSAGGIPTRACRQTSLISKHEEKKKKKEKGKRKKEKGEGEADLLELGHESKVPGRSAM